MSTNELALNAALEGSLPFEEERQIAFVGHVTNYQDKGLFLQVKDKIEPDWFLNAWCGRIYRAYRSFWEKYNRIPLSKEELFAYDEIAKLSMAEKLKIHDVANQSNVLMSKYGVDVLTKDLTDWARCRVYHSRVKESARLFNSKQLGSAVAVLEDAIREFQQTNFEGAAPVSWENPKMLVDSQSADYENALTTGLPIFDSHLVPECNGKGGLLRGDTTVIVAPVNIGKTTTMVTIARHNLRAQKSVLFVSLEGRELDVSEKMWQCMMGVNKAEFRRMVMSNDPNDQHKIKVFSALLSKNLTFLSMTKPGLAVEDVIATIRMHQNRRKALTGQGFDLVVVDYPTILSSKARNTGSKYEYRQEKDYIFRQFVQLALEEKFHALLAAQTNREGSKANRNNKDGDGKSSSRLLTMEDIAEAFGIAHSATNVITVNRDMAAQAADRIIFYICKSRSNQTDWAIACKSDFRKSLSHSVDMEHTSWRGNDPLNDNVDDLLKSWNNKTVPAEQVYGLRKGSK